MFILLQNYVQIFQCWGLLSFSLTSSFCCNDVGPMLSSWSQVGAAAQDKWLPDTWRWRHYDIPKHQEPLTQWHHVTLQQTWLLSNTTVRPSNLALQKGCWTFQPTHFTSHWVWEGQNSYTRCQALTRVLLKMQVFWDTKLCYSMSCYWWIDSCCCLGIHHEVVQVERYLQSI